VINVFKNGENTFWKYKGGLQIMFFIFLKKNHGNAGTLEPNSSEMWFNLNWN
jgi:hypothetical protein